MIEIIKLQSGEEFNWTFGGVDIHLFMGEEEE